MPCSANAAALRLICLWIEHSINHPQRRLRLADVLIRENVEVVAACLENTISRSRSGGYERPIWITSAVRR